MEDAEPAAISLFPAGTRHSLRSAACNELVVELAPNLLERSFGGQPVALELETKERIQDSRIQHLMYALLEGVRTGCPTGSEITSRPVMPPARLNRVLAYIDEKADENLRLADLAKAAGMSTFHFAKLFKQSTGQSPHQYLLARRMEAAKRLLRQEEAVSVLEVSARTGFVDQRHFTKVFRRFTGFTPTAYRAAV
jgi:AraC-like DNA-binding protein